MTNLKKADAILETIARKKKEQPGQVWDPKTCRKILRQVIADKLTRIEKAEFGDVEQAKEILIYYPRRIAPVKAYNAIVKAIAIKGYDYILERTQAYADAVSNWSHDWRFRGSGGSDMVPHPASWYNAGSYDDDPREWVGDRKYNVQAATRPKELKEQEGWQDVVCKKYPDMKLINGIVTNTQNGRKYAWDDLPNWLMDELTS
ncbi:hypothetical protein N8Z76_00435 [Gammaproteobacteria bacterium]|nr:hypothetical protein [Gammaproteobacteria bacterium]